MAKLPGAVRRRSAAARPSRRPCARPAATSAEPPRASDCPAKRCTAAWNASTCALLALPDGADGAPLERQPQDQARSDVLKRGGTGGGAGSLACEADRKRRRELV